MSRDRAGTRGHTPGTTSAAKALRGPMFEAAFAFTLDGRRFGDEPVRVRSASAYETRYPTKDVEFEIVSRVLARVARVTSPFETGERPDWKIRFPNGDVIGAEASEIDLTADFTNRLIDLRIALLEAIAAEPWLPIGKRSITFSFGALAFPKGLNADALPRRARRALLKGMLAYLRAGHFGAGVTAYEVLQRYDVKVYVFDFDHPHVDLTTPATSYFPTGPPQAAIQRVALKTERAKKYDHRHPLWLFLAITDMMGEFSDTLMTLGKLNLAIRPFDAVFLTDQREIAVLR